MPPLNEDHSQLSALLSLSGAWVHHTLHPSRTEQNWIQIYRHGIRANILSPLTSFTVLENETQMKTLRKKQQQALNSEKYLDTGEDFIEMSEPSAIILLIVFCLLLLAGHRNFHKKN